MKHIIKGQYNNIDNRTLHYFWFLLLLFILSIHWPLMAQDTLILKSNDTLIVYLVETRDTEVEYRKSPDSDSRYIMSKNKISILLPAKVEKDTLPIMIHQTVRIYTKDNEKFIGEVVEQDLMTIALKTANGVMKLDVDKVRTIAPYKYKVTNLNASQYFVLPSAIPLQKGETYYQNLWFTSNYIHYGVSKHFSISGGIELISTLFGAPVLTLTPKLGFQINKTNYAGAGMMLFSLSGEGLFVIPYGIYTLGNAERNISIGAGYAIGTGYAIGVGYGQMDEEQNDYPGVIFAGMHKLGKRFALVTENCMISFPHRDEDTYLGIHGIKYIYKNFSIDLGGIVFFQKRTQFSTVPYLGFSLAF